ncbi:ATP-dependent protease ATPase subunit HslU [Halodesulfovibrio marinisediminis]|uniref:ATP-dependent protease ATPase subunit HslU n=1 Tax=Halodesulfovibrio marinisediminis DSM 17456 TaxID=1121457 RepID=A0A1N6J8J2_9BACT|nr:ATP-dependent protease ATPase subunit HslU [Halodesulfovibrio marinisediminis]SIO40592.1 ATP-dependent HslUV protease ATP-binding subunit HslU [Halodesulfovibrio marinisediminis DSM 17456]
MLTPREIVSELDKYIIGQHGAKRMVAVAMRNRWRRQQIDPSLRDEIAPKNIIMMGPTGVGKTEIARRLAKLSASPFVKVEATKFTEVGYVGRDVESMVRDLMELGVALVRDEETTRVRAQAETNAEERLLDLLLPGSAPKPIHDPITTFDTPTPETDKASSTREKMRKMFREGKLDDREVEMELEIAPQGIEVMAMPGMEDMGSQFKDLFSKAFPAKKKKKRMKIGDALPLLIEEEAARLVDEEKVTELAKERVEQSGIIFIDEIDKVASSQHGGKSADISREGVQRDLLPIVEGSVVNTKYGMVKTDHILFIGAGAFHHSKPADLIPELQGRFPLRAELTALGKEEFLRILKEPHNALTIQYTALLATEGVTITFAEDGLEEIASFAEMTNQETENIGARRLYTIMEKILSDISFEAPDRSGEEIVIDRAFVEKHLEDVREDRDLSRYIL